MRSYVLQCLTCKNRNPVPVQEPFRFFSCSLFVLNGAVQLQKIIDGLGEFYRRLVLRIFLIKDEPRQPLPGQQPGFGQGDNWEVTEGVALPLAVLPVHNKEAKLAGCADANPKIR